MRAGANVAASASRRASDAEGRRRRAGARAGQQRDESPHRAGGRPRSRRGDAEEGLAAHERADRVCCARGSIRARPGTRRSRFARPAPRNLAPRAPDLPELRVHSPANPSIACFARTSRSTTHAGVASVDDRQFIRRATLDVVGELPTPDEVRAFVADRAPDKRERLVARLLADDRRYAEHWLSFWNDLLRNDYRGTGYIDGGREQITAWLYAALANNLPYDQFVAALVNPTPGSRGLHQGHRLARRGQRQPDAGDAGGAEHLAGLHGREPEVRVVPRQLHQRLAAVRLVRPRQHLRRSAARDGGVRSADRARPRA